jgi:hypothetical protein
MSNGQMFTAWYEQELRDIRKMKKGVSPSAIVQREEWQRLSVRTRTVLQLFFNSVDGHPDKVAFIDTEMLAEIQKHVAADILENPDVRKIIDLFLGAETSERQM